MTNIECLNMALKLTQYVRASRSKHPIGVIQQYCIEKLGYDNFIEQEFSRITDKEEITRVAQLTLNKRSDFTRSRLSKYLLIP